MISQNESTEEEPEKYLPGFNEIWDFYLQSNFLYPDKKAVLLPYFDEISKTWEKLLKSRNNLFNFIYTKKNNKLSSSICSAQYCRNTVSIFHTAAINDPKGVCENTIQAIRRGIEHQECYFGTLVYRYSNRFAKRVISYVKKRLNRDVFEHHTYSYSLSENNSSLFELKNTNGLKVQYLKPEEADEFENILITRLSSLYLDSKGFRGDEIFLTETSKKYSESGLFRTREILLLRRHDRLIAYSSLEDSSLAINFSLIFNAFTITVIDNDLSGLDLLIKASINHYIRKGLQFAVCLSENIDGDVLETAGLKIKKEYCELILSKKNNGFASALVHFENLYNQYFQFVQSFLPVKQEEV